jgi:hypothetical protein
VERGPSTTPEPSDESQAKSHNESLTGSEPAAPTAHDLITIFYDSLEEVRTLRQTPKNRNRRRPIPKSGPNSRGSFARDVDRALREGQGPSLVERAVRRRALRWDEHCIDLATAIGDILDDKPWTAEQELRRSFTRQKGYPVRQSTRELVAAAEGLSADDYDEERY